MVRRLVWSSILGTVMVVSGGWALAWEQAPLAQALQAPQPAWFEYRVHRGESVSEIARRFHLSMADLLQANGMTDPSRLQSGQVLRVPNRFVSQLGQVQAERNHLLVEKEQLARQVAIQHQRIDALEKEAQERAAERATLAAERTRMLEWQRGLQVVILVMVGFGVWNLRLRSEQRHGEQRLALVEQEKGALQAANATLRQATAQLELKYQQLYGGRGAGGARVAAEGSALLAQTFARGRAQLEQVLAQVLAEQARAAQREAARWRPQALLWHPLRSLRQRLKYHAA